MGKKLAFKLKKVTMDTTSLQDALKTLTANDPVGIAVPVFLLLILLEAGISAWEQRNWYETKDAFASLGMGLGSVLVNLISKLFFFLIFTWLYQNAALFRIEPAWWSWILLFFLDDLSFYWHHRTSHEVRILWASHSNHHSSQRYNLSTALRQSWTEFLYKYVFWIWLPVLGFPPVMIFTMISISLIYQFFLHTESVRRLGWLEYVLNTPSHHRVHHATNLKYLDRNHGGMLIIWDRLFGTFEPEDPNDPPVYGLTQNIHTYNPVRIAFAEHEKIATDLRRAPDWKTRLRYLVSPPGWSHDGSSKTTRELRRNLPS